MLTTLAIDTKAEVLHAFMLQRVARLKISKSNNSILSMQTAIQLKLLNIINQEQTTFNSTRAALPSQAVENMIQYVSNTTRIIPGTFQCLHNIKKLA